MSKITTIVLTKNEEKNLKECLNSIKFADEIIVIDDNSTDKTVSIAKERGAIVIENTLATFSEQRNLGLKKASYEWVLFIDADEIIPKDLALEIQKAIERPYDGYFILRKDKFLGHDMRFGDLGNVWLLRLAKKDKALWVGDIHEILKVNGRTTHLKNSILHSSHENISEFVEKIDNYSTLRALELKKNKVKPFLFDVLLFPLGKFTYLYIFKLGFLDGIYGFIHAIFMSMYSFLVRGKLHQMYRNDK